MSERRVQFVVRAAQAGANLSGLCREFEISRPTGYLWLRRYRESGRLQELAEKSRRPKRSPRRTEEKLEERIAELRRERPDWGAPKIRVLLEREGVRLPVSTIHRILLRRGLVQERDRHGQATQRFTRAEPNQLGQMDFKGMGEEHKPCAPLVVVDDHSRFLVGLFALQGTAARPVQGCLEAVFREYGLPEALLMDHGTPWWNMQSQWGWTWLTVWLIEQGIRLIFSGYRHPQTQGKVERSNGSLEAALRKRGKQAGQEWQPWLDHFREEYNHVRPHQALGMDVPAQHWKPSSRLYQPAPPSWEYPADAIVRKVRENGGVKWQGRSYFISRAFSGEWVRLQPLEQRMLVWCCLTPLRELDLSTGASYALHLGQDRRARQHGFARQDRGLAPS